MNNQPIKTPPPLSPLAQRIKKNAVLRSLSKTLMDEPAKYHVGNKMLRTM